jgi:hypothetical protein
MADISVSFSKMSYDPSRKDYSYFKTAVGPFSNLTKYLTREVWSPVVWHTGKRAKANFLKTHLIGLDFDDGIMSLEEAKEYVVKIGIDAIIGITRSHQIEKISHSSGEVKPPCDRFRIILLAEECTSLADYEYTNSVFMDNLPCDKSCKDGARYFAPCREIVFTQFNNVKVEWLTAPPKRQMPVASYTKGQMPLWIADLINHGTELGGRHKTCYKIGAQLFKYGYAEADIVTKILKGPLGAIGREDVERAVRNGISAANGGEW